MEMRIEIADKVSKNIANAPTPYVVMVSGDNKGGTGAEEAMKVFGAERAIELMQKLEKTGKK